MSNPFDEVVVNTIFEQVRSSFTPGSAPDVAPEPAEPEVMFNEEEETDTLKSKKMYSEVFEGAADYLKESGLEDFDVSRILFERDDWKKEHQIFIPELDNNYIWQHEVLYPAVRALVADLKVLVVGPTGSGKTDMYKNVAAICQQPYLRIGGRGDMESDTIFGKMVIKPDGSMEFMMADFPVGFGEGWMIALDEPWKLPAHITMAWQRVLERGGVLQLDDMPGSLEDKQIHKHPRTRMVLCDNVVGTGDGADRFAATMIQDSSTLNRIDLVLELGYLPHETEVHMLTNRFTFLPEKQAHKAVQLANLIRDGYEKNQIGVTMSPRNLMAWLECAYAIKSYDRAFKWVMLNRYAEEADKETIRNFWATVYGENLS
jgi:cobaltochelatase CobS